MTTTVNVSWDLPTARTSGNPLDPALIAAVDVSLSADAGANFVLTDTVVPANPQNVTYPDLVDGDYVIRLVVRLTTGQASSGLDTPLQLDTSAPENVANVQITFP
jgi:hypothetical protein